MMLIVANFEFLINYTAHLTLVNIMRGIQFKFIITM